MKFLTVFLCTIFVLFRADAARAQVERTGPANPGRVITDRQSEQRMSELWHYGCELFQMLLEESDCRLTQDLDDCLADPAASVIVLVGDIPDNYIPRRMAQFARRGGGILLATDSPYRLAGVCNVSGVPLSTDLRSQQVQGFRDVIRLKDLAGRHPLHPLLSGVQELVLNRSSWIELIDRGLGTPNSAVKVPRTVLPRESWDRSILATVEIERAPTARFIIAADHSLFTNGMLWHGDNALLAINVCKFLTQGGRKKLIFIKDGVPMSSYREQLAKLPRNPPDVNPEVSLELDAEQMLQVLNKTVAKAEDADLINALIANRPRRISTRYYHRGLLFALAGGLLVMALACLLWRSPALSRPRATRSMQAPRVIGSDLAVQHSGGIRRAEAARLIACDFMNKLTRSADPDQWQQYVSNFHRQHQSSSPEIAFYESAAQLDQVLQAATSLDTKPMSRQTLLKLGRTMDQLSPAVEKGSGVKNRYGAVGEEKGSGVKNRYDPAGASHF